MKQYDEKSDEVHSPPDTSPEDMTALSDPVLDSSQDLPELDEPEIDAEEIFYTDLPERPENSASSSPNESDEPPSRWRILNAFAFWGVILLGAVLRFWDLGVKPLHHDESMHAYFSLQLLHNNIENWVSCVNGTIVCYTYNPLLHGPFQFHAIAFVYLIAHWVGAFDYGVNDFTARIVAASLGTVMVGLPYFLRGYMGKLGAWLGSFLIAVSPSLVYFSRFTREAIYMACFTLLIVVATGRYVQSRKIRWLIWAAAAFSLSYATAEATFLTVAIFGSFLGAVIAWEVGKRWQLRASVSTDAAFRNALPQTGGLVAVALYFLIFLPIAKIGLGQLTSLSLYISKNVPTSDQFVLNLKNNTVMTIPWIGMLLGLYVLSVLIREILGKLPIAGRHGLAKRVDPKRQPLLDTIVTMPWTHWFFALLMAWVIFLVLFTALFTNIHDGIGDGIWQGLYYWLQQQGVARGGQPWYYYLLLIPLYEQVGVVFGIVGIIRCLRQPTPFRLFLVYWCVGTLFIYSWAAEKMPWLMIHITMPLMLLAAIGLEPAVLTVWNWLQAWMQQRRASSLKSSTSPDVTEQPIPSRPVPRPVGVLTRSMAVLSAVCAVLLLVPTLHNMYEVSYVHPADGPHEMMIYVQTTTDVDIVMARITALDQKLDQGKHQLSIGIMSWANWPFYWYLRDYTNVCYNFPTGCPTQNPAIIVAAQDDSIPPAYTGGQYLSQQYKLRSWWDEGYKPVPCVPTPANNNCAGQDVGGGVGLGPWLSYGDAPSPGATFNLGLAVKNIWNWWWYRKAIGSTDGAYYMTVLIQKGVGVTP